MEHRPRTIRSYRTANGANPYRDWINGLAHKRAGQVRVRLDRIAEHGHFGDCEPVGNGVFELKFRSGLRVYFGHDGDDVILVAGGNKGTQAADIVKAKEYWSDYNA